MNDYYAHTHRILLQELHVVELELTDIGHLYPTEHGIWIASAPTDITPEPADMNEMGDFDTAQENNKAVIIELKARYKDLEEALKALENGTYGMCVVCNKKISEKRLHANIAARTCIEHS
ncbi:MAG: hypothetical protein WAX38_03825 [Minisyncoccia bacterium]